LDGIYLPIQLTEWPLVEKALLLIGLAHISFDKNWYLTLYRRDQSSLDCQFCVKNKPVIAIVLPVDESCKRHVIF
jgi:hypothetical protein